MAHLQVQTLVITPDHAQRYYEIQAITDHKDPFDRSIIAQAASTGFTVLSDDRKFPLYPVTVISNYDQWRKDRFLVRGTIRRKTILCNLPRLKNRFLFLGQFGAIPQSPTVEGTETAF